MTTPDTLPDSLQRDVRALYAAPVPVSPSVDSAILALARQRALAGGRRRSLTRRWGLAAAAGLALGITLTIYLTRPGSGGQVAMDVNQDGIVDILDALTLERAIGANGRGGSGLVDLNGDGAVDRLDVDRVAMAAVALKGGKS